MAVGDMYVSTEMETLAYVRGGGGGDRGERKGEVAREGLGREIGEGEVGREAGRKRSGRERLGGWGGGWKIKKASSMETNMCIRKSSILADHGLQACTYVQQTITYVCHESDTCTGTVCTQTTHIRTYSPYNPIMEYPHHSQSNVRKSWTQSSALPRKWLWSGWVCEPKWSRTSSTTLL